MNTIAKKIVFVSLFSIVMGVSIIMFILAGYTFLTASGDPGKINTAKMAFFWGVVGVGLALLSSSIPWLVRNVLIGGGSGS